ncbi:hypothetical protein ACFOVT_18910, partial [Novosphingobium lubricantis]
NAASNGSYWQKAAYYETANEPSSLNWKTYFTISDYGLMGWKTTDGVQLSLKNKLPIAVKGGTFIIDINGEGTAKGAGEYFIGDTLTLQAIPEESVEFGCWLIADNETLKPEDRLKVSDNPFTIQVTPQITAKGNMKVEAYFYMSMREYLKAQIDYELKNTSYISVAQKWG